MKTSKKIKKIKTAIICDSLVQPGGADRVVEALVEIFPEAVIYTSICDKEQYSQILSQEIRTTFIQRLPFHKFFFRHYVPLSPIGFESFDLSKYDLVISLSAGCAKGVITAVDTFHLGIILTPPRYQWGGAVNKRASTFRLLFKLIVPFFDHYLRIWDVEASKRPDRLISISKFIQKRIQKTYRRSSQVVYPGVDTNFYYQKTELKQQKREDFFLCVSRLYDYKRLDLAIKVCQELHQKLIIVGQGPDRDYLEEVANPQYVEFTGYITDKEVRDYMRKCKGFIFPGLEDFGLVVIEAMSCGAPIIGFNRGGVCETVRDGVTGVLFDKQSVSNLKTAIHRFKKIKFNYDIIEQEGHKYSKEIFKNKICQIINEKFEHQGNE
jgi:glycosyltransferase involved in cell wall biosynthesis